MATLTPDRLTAAYMAQSTVVRERVVAFAVALWGASASLRDADVDRLVSRIIPVVQGGQLQAANLANAYIQRLAALEGIVAEPSPVRKSQVIEYRGVDAHEVYRRPAVQTYTALAAGKTFEVARQEGLNRLKALVSTDVQQSRNRQARVAYGDSDFSYTVRVLSGAENCALCVIASTQRYNVGELQPIHPGCDCGERGVRAGRDPGLVVDQRLLDLTYAQVDKKITDGTAPELGAKRDRNDRPLSDYTDLIISREHGELGPTLTWRSDNFTGASDL